MKRRSLLKAIAAGSTTAVMPMAALLARSAMAQGMRPIRTIFLFHPNGCVPDIFFPPAGSGANALPAMSAPLRDVFQHCVFLDGIGYAGPANTHEGGSAKCLTGYPGSNNSGSEGYSSIDVLMGKQDWANRATSGISVPSVQMGVGTKWGGDRNKRISFDGTQDLNAEDNPHALYPTLFGGISGGGMTGAGTRMLSAIREDLQRLRSQLGSIERARLDQHSDSLSVLEAQLQSMEGTACALPDISRVSAPAHYGERESKLWSSAVLETVSDVQQNIAVQALSCNITRTIAFSYGVSVSPIIVPGTNTADHDLSHQSPAEHTTSKIWWMNELKKFIQKLANTPDGNGDSLLDNTIICTVSDLAHGNYHNHFRIPMVLAGGKNANLVTGRALDFRPYGRPRIQGDQNSNSPSISHTDVLNTIAVRAGYTGIVLPQSDGFIHNAWTGGVSP